MLIKEYWAGLGAHLGRGAGLSALLAPYGEAKQK